MERYDLNPSASEIRASVDPRLHLDDVSDAIKFPCSCETLAKGQGYVEEVTYQSESTGKKAKALSTSVYNPTSSKSGFHPCPESDIRMSTSA